jgi:hypothetical protein
MQIVLVFLQDDSGSGSKRVSLRSPEHHRIVCLHGWIFCPGRGLRFWLCFLLSAVPTLFTFAPQGGNEFNRAKHDIFIRVVSIIDESGARLSAYPDQPFPPIPSAS